MDHECRWQWTDAPHRKLRPGRGHPGLLMASKSLSPPKEASTLPTWMEAALFDWQAAPVVVMQPTHLGPLMGKGSPIISNAAQLVVPTV
jgi:hypothetical protein